MTLQIFSRRKNQLRHKQLNQFRSNTADDFLVGGAFIHHKLIVAVVVIFTENGFGAVANNIASSFLRIFKKVGVVTVNPSNCRNNTRGEDGFNYLTEEIICSLQNGSVTSRRSGGTVSRCGDKFIDEIISDLIIPVDDIEIRIGVGKVRRVNLIFKTIIVVTVDYSVIRPLPKVFALFLGEESVAGIRKRCNFFTADFADISEFRAEPFGKCFLNGAVENDRRHLLEYIRRKLVKQSSCRICLKIQSCTASVQSVCERRKPVAVVLIVLQIVTGCSFEHIFTTAGRFFGLIVFRFFSRVFISYGIQHIAGVILAG